MNSINKKSAGARSIPQPLNRHAGHAPQLKPVVAQLKTGVSAQSVKRPIAPPVYRPQATPKVLQTKSTPALSTQAGQARPQPAALPVYRPDAKRIIQLNKKCNCGRPGNKHNSSCPANKNFNKNANVKVKKAKIKVSTFENLKCYRPGWVNRNNITAERVELWGGKIRGHCSSSGDKDSGEQENTKTDLAAFKSWYTDNYGWK